MEFPEKDKISLLTSSKKLNLGCGFDRRDGYLNVDLNDFHGPDVVADVSNLSEFPDGFYDEILAQDVLEHMTREVSKKAFNEWSRLLSNDGVMHVRIPSLLDLVRLFNRSWDAASHNNFVHLMFGTQAYNGDYHLSGFTPPILLEMAEHAGVMLSSAVLCDDWLYDLTFVKRRDPTHEEFLHQQYFEILGRCADPEGFAHYLDRLNKGESRETIRSNFLDSDEARSRQ